MHNGICVKEDDCADYPLTSCDFPGAVSCSKCPSDSSKMKLEVCAPTYDSFAPHNDERGVTYWIKTTDGTCPVGAICAPANATWYTKVGNTCVPNEHNNKIVGCKTCYRKAYMGPECVYDASYCSDVTYTLTLDPNNNSCNSATHTMHAGEQFQSKLNPPSGCSSQYFDGWYTSKSGGTKYGGSNTMPASDLTLYAHWRSPSSNGFCHQSNVGPACYLIYGTNNKNSSSWVTFSSTYSNSEAYDKRESYCNAISDEETCSSQGILKWYNGGNTLIMPVTLPYSIDPLLIGAQATNVCCEWSGPS